jgi:hypothetical protein
MSRQKDELFNPETGSDIEHHEDILREGKPDEPDFTQRNRKIAKDAGLTQQELDEFFPLQK